jgi:branched-chain amino acid transport system substrate-binding protein
MMRIKSLLLGLTVILLVGCDESYEQSKQKRIRQSPATSQDNKAPPPIVIGVPWKSAQDDGFIDGVKLAVKEINQKGGVLKNIPLQIIINDSESAFYDSTLSVKARRDAVLNIANTYAANPDLIAVIGHASSESAVIASVVYQNNGILFLAPNARYKKLTGHNFSYTFRTSLNNEFMAAQLADYAAQKGYKRIAILNACIDAIQEFVNEFTTYAVEKHAAEIISRHSFFEDTVDIISLVADLKNIQNVDAICIATNSKKAAEIYQQIRNVGIKLPIIGNVALDNNEVLSRAKQWETSKKIQKLNIPTLYDITTAKGRQFDQQFRQEYGQNVQADYLAALGYDAVNLLAHAIQYAKSTVPAEIALTLRYMDACKGVAGKYEFEANGDLKNKPVSFFHLEGNNYVFEHVNHRVMSDTTATEVCNEIDRDHDGIPSYSDACPDTTATEMAKGVNQYGAERGCPIDSDNDEIADYKDSCPTNTPAEIAKSVDARGCPVDSDKDGIGDYADKDVDGDKVANDEDTCLKSNPQELIYGVNLTGKKAGCPVDSDADSVLDYLDNCRTNSESEVSQGVGATGCPVDRDLDGVLDYQDKCLKSSAGFLIDAEGCEAIASTTTLKSAKLLFAEKQFNLTAAGEKYLDGLLVHSHLPLLKKIQITGYTVGLNQVIFQNRLQSIASYFQQKNIPVEKVEIAVKDSVAEKNNVMEFIFSELKPAKPAKINTKLMPSPIPIKSQTQ